MKLQYLFQGLCLLKAIEAQTEQEQAKALCETLNEQLKTLDSGHKFKFLCGKTGVTPGKLDLPGESGTVDECAEICATNDECKGAAWDWKFNSCQLYTSGDDLQARRTAIFVRREEVTDPKALCESMNGEIKTLAGGHKFKYICGKTGTTPGKLDLPGESGTVDECAEICATNDECKGAAWDWKFNSCQLYTSGDDLQARRTAIFVRREEVTDPKSLCESMNGEIKTLAGGHKFKYICGKTGTTPGKLDLPGESGTVDECAEICATNDECKGAAWDWKFNSCQLYTSGDDLQARRNAIFLRREVESGSADCTAVEKELRECEEAENDLQESLDKCQITKTESEQAHATMTEKLEACEFERDLCAEGQGDAEKCEVENSQIRDLTEELQQCNTAAVSNAAELEQCQSASSACDFDLQQCQNSVASGALELQRYQSASSSCALELQQSQAAASSNANQLQQCQNAASAAAIQLQQCQNTASSSALELQQCKNNAASSLKDLQQCKANAASSTKELQQCKSDAESSIKELQQCKANAAASAGVPAFKECNAGGNGQVVKIGNRSFKQKCNVSMWKHLMPLRRVVRPGLTRQECAMICAMDGGCQSVYFVRSTATVGECQLQSQNIESRLNYGNSDIAFIPV
ncbi:hypothetical protein N7463_009731 [Penicillium fimorum]|uniref:Apple domain-containing protein n=1 Tax=Penicillium fimorum TaxID=1882269 RepID=A0A9X0C147_9EURO|nr:hypothetical protein N7463_009731 [Penicillium fimorum]